MSTLLIQIFGAMGGTFLLGLALGWIIWKFGGPSDDTDVEFWQGRFEQSRNELVREQNTLEALRAEHKSVKDRLSKLKNKSSS